MNNLLKIIPKMEQHLQQQLQQQQAGEFEEVNDNNADDSRFEVPTEALLSVAGGGGAVSNGLNVVVAADAINLAPSSTNATNYAADGFLDDMAVEERIK